MLRADGRNQPHLRVHQLNQFADIAHMARAHLGDKHLMGRRELFADDAVTPIVVLKLDGVASTLYLTDRISRSKNSCSSLHSCPVSRF